MDHRTVTLKNGQKVVLVDREQLRFKRHGRMFGLPDHLVAFKRVKLPTAPVKFSGSKNRTIKYPILGNDQYGDCYEADALHCIQTWTGNVGTEVQFDLRAVINEYLQLSGGDNGLSDDDVFPHWRGPGFQGHRILDEMTVDPADAAAIRLAMYLFCGASYTCSLLSGWLNATDPGTIWDANMGRPDPSAGHAMHLSGYDATAQAGQLQAGYFEDETWAIDPPIRLTPAGIRASDPEITVQFSLEMFGADGIAPHNGMSYEQLATLWVQLGGANLPPSPFPPAPGPTPVPPVPPGPPSSGITLLLPPGLPPGTYTVGPSGAPSVDPAQVLKIVDELLALFNIPPLAWPMSMRSRLLTVGQIPWGKVLQIIALVMAAIQGGLTPDKLAALMAQILAILTGQ
ncbi:MAG: hypothetical protein JOZ10_16125 [Acidobacteria bacterium]|nr:hypothetical protein [Acidobacteriota bacterium]